jgi:hypothetical protein
MDAAADDDDDGPELPSLRVRAAWLVAFGLMIVAAQFVFLFFMFSPTPWKTVIGEVKLGNGTTLSVGRGHEGKTSHVYYVRVRGTDCKPVEWTEFASGVTAVERCEMAWTPDSRFTGMVVRGRETLGSVIYDAVDDELWFGREADVPKRIKFVRAWKQLEKVNPRVVRKAG